MEDGHIGFMSRRIRSLNNENPGAKSRFIGFSDHYISNVGTQPYQDSGNGCTSPNCVQSFTSSYGTGVKNYTNSNRLTGGVNRKVESA
jgi:hypothetical protein